MPPGGTRDYYHAHINTPFYGCRSIVLHFDLVDPFFAFCFFTCWGQFPFYCQYSLTSSPRLPCQRRHFVWGVTFKKKKKISLKPARGLVFSILRNGVVRATGRALHYLLSWADRPFFVFFCILLDVELCGTGMIPAGLVMILGMSA